MQKEWDAPWRFFLLCFVCFHLFGSKLTYKVTGLILAFLYIHTGLADTFSWLPFPVRFPRSSSLRIPPSIFLSCALDYPLLISIISLRIPFLKTSSRSLLSCFMVYIHTYIYTHTAHYTYTHTRAKYNPPVRKNMWYLYFCVCGGYFTYYHFQIYFSWKPHHFISLYGCTEFCCGY